MKAPIKILAISLLGIFFMRTVSGTAIRFIQELNEVAETILEDSDFEEESSEFYISLVNKFEKNLALAPHSNDVTALFYSIVKDVPVPPPRLV